MAYQIKFTKKAEIEFESLDNSIKLNIEKRLKKLISVENPRVFGESLRGDLAGYWKYRVDDYRIIAEIYDDKLIIMVVAIDHRRKVYKKLSKRLKDQNL